MIPTDTNIAQFLRDNGAKHPLKQAISDSLYWIVSRFWDEEFGHYPQTYGFRPDFMLLPDVVKVANDGVNITLDLPNDVTYYQITDNGIQLGMSRNIQRPEIYDVAVDDLFVATDEVQKRIQEQLVYQNQQDRAHSFFQYQGRSHPRKYELWNNDFFRVVPERLQEEFSHYPKEHGFNPAFAYVPSFSQRRLRGIGFQHVHMYDDITFFSLEGEQATKRYTTNLRKTKGQIVYMNELYFDTNELKSIVSPQLK